MLFCKKTVYFKESFLKKPPLCEDETWLDTRADNGFA